MNEEFDPQNEKEEQTAAAECENTEDENASEEGDGESARVKFFKFVYLCLILVPIGIFDKLAYTNTGTQITDMRLIFVYILPIIGAFSIVYPKSSARSRISRLRFIVKNPNRLEPTAEAVSLYRLSGYITYLGSVIALIIIRFSMCK